MSLLGITLLVANLQVVSAEVPTSPGSALQKSLPGPQVIATGQAQNDRRLTSEPIAGGGSDTVIAVLRAQLSERRESDDRLLTTVYWSLGTIAGVSILLLGFGWWSNFRVYERDKIALKQDLGASLSEEFNKLQVISRDELSKLRAATQEEMARFQVSMRTDVDALRQSVDTRLNSVREELAGSVAGKIKAGVAPVNTEISSLKAKILSLSIEAVDTEMERWAEQKVWDNAIRAALRVISLATQTGEEWRITRALEALTRFVNAGGGTDSFTYAQVIDVLDKLPEAHTLDVSNIKRTLQENRAKRGV